MGEISDFTEKIIKKTLKSMAAEVSKIRINCKYWFKS